MCKILKLKTTAYQLRIQQNTTNEIGPVRHCIISDLNNVNCYRTKGIQSFLSLVVLSAFEDFSDFLQIQGLLW